MYSSKYFKSEKNYTFTRILLFTLKKCNTFVVSICRIVSNSMTSIIVRFRELACQFDESTLEELIK